MDPSPEGSPFQAGWVGRGLSVAESPFQAVMAPSAPGSPFHVGWAAMVPSVAVGSPFHAVWLGIVPSAAGSPFQVATTAPSPVSGFSFQVTVPLAPSASPPFQAVCVATWRSSRVRWEKYLLQMQHWKRSGRCVRMWTFKELF